MVSWYLVLLGVVASERGLELFISRRNAHWALAHGGIEFGQRHFRLMVLVHVSFLFSCAAEVVCWQRPVIPALAISMGILALAAQALRYWAVMTLGRRWNVRVIVVPWEAAVTSGPYRYVRHPNYLAVLIEAFAVPLVHTAWLTALIFTLLNAMLLAVRIRCEERALTRYCSYRERLGRRGRFFPTRWVASAHEH